MAWIIQSKGQKQKQKRMNKSEQSLRVRWDTIKWANIHIYGSPSKGRESVRNNIWRNNGWKLSKFDERHYLHHAVSSRNSKQDKCKESHTKTHYNQAAERQRESWKQWEKQLVTYMESSIRLKADFSSESMETRRQLDDIFKALKKRRKKLSAMNFIFTKTLLQN